MLARATTICLTTLLVLQSIAQAHCRSTGDYSAETNHRLHHHHHHHRYHHHKHHRNNRHHNQHRQDEQLQFETKQLSRLAEDDDDNSGIDEASLVPLSRVRREPPRLPELDGNDQGQINSEEEDDYGRASRYRDRSGRYRRPTESPSRPHNSTDDPFLYDISAAHGKTVCPYEIVPVPEEPGREPRNLLHLTCLKRGSTCRGVPDKKSNGGGKDNEGGGGAFCCIQLYRDIELRWDDGRRPNTWLRLDSGCVCTEKKYMPLRRFESGADVDLDE